jgi:hypothetical protein
MVSLHGLRELLRSVKGKDWDYKSSGLVDSSNDDDHGACRGKISMGGKVRIGIRNSKRRWLMMVRR